MIKNDNSGIINLKFVECRFTTKENLHLLNQLIEKNKNKLIVFTFSRNKFKNKGIDMILSSLRMNNTLRQISLGNNYINNEDFINLGDYLAFNTSLLILGIIASKLGRIFFLINLSNFYLIIYIIFELLQKMRRISGKSSSSTKIRNPIF